MTPTATTQVAAVIGAPVRHSLSPAIHAAAFDAAGRDWTFLAFEVAPGEGAAAVAAMRTLGIRGLAVTTPHKEDVIAALDVVDEAARRLRSVNTVVLRADGTTFGTSTDGDGLVASVLAAGHPVAGVGAAVVGAGAAARAIVEALGRAGAAEVVVVNRTVDRAEVAAALTPVGRVGDLDDLAAAGLVVHATSVGMGDPGALPLDPSRLRAGQVVVDIVYHPLDTGLLRAARAAGAATVDGLGMLVHQAALQQRWWTGDDPDVGAMRAAAEAELARRHR
ncbi:MAG: shikimate dehydrogenase [Ilumatobacteraceae bacterium]|nr:shikimate dehydrogenase [Ilumatobacteraceae bacterium]